jgi:hypothetical protein
VVNDESSQIFLTSALIICALLLFVSINIALIGYILVLAWTTYRLLIRKDFTLLQTSMFQNASLKMPNFEHLSEDQISKYQGTAYRVGWWILAVTVVFIILLVYINI